MKFARNHWIGIVLGAVLYELHYRRGGKSS